MQKEGAIGNLNGWKALEEYTGMSKNTIKKYIEKYDFPVETDTGKPKSTTRAIDAWWDDRLKNRVKKQARNRKPTSV